MLLVEKKQLESMNSFCLHLSSCCVFFDASADQDGGAREEPCPAVPFGCRQAPSQIFW